MPAGLGRGHGLGKADGLAADDFPGFGGDGLVVKVGQIDQADNGRYILTDGFRSAAAGHQTRRPDVDALLDVVSEQHGAQPASHWRVLARATKSRGYVADRFGMAEIIAHELFDRQQAAYFADTRAPRQCASCSAAVEHFGRLLGVKMQLVAQAQEEFPRGR